MKTKEQILLETTGRTRLSEFGPYAEDYIQAMQSYADQQTAELRSEVEIGKSMYGASLTVITELRDQVKDMNSTIPDLRRKLSDCERKRITGQRL